MGGISLNFLRQVPEGQAPAGVKGSSTPVPWREMLFFSPFRKLLVTSLAWAVAYGGISTFIVAFLKSETALTERDIMASNSWMLRLPTTWFVEILLERIPLELNPWATKI